MRNILSFLSILLGILMISIPVSGQRNYWSTSNAKDVLETDKAVARVSFPKQYNLFSLRIESLRQELFSVVGTNPLRHSTIISLPNAENEIEQFEVFEASNFEPELQARFPEIRAFSGRGVTDRNATLKLSISPQGIQTMVFRTDKKTEFIEPYSRDHSVYAVYKSQREKGRLPWTCSTEDQQIASGLTNQIERTSPIESNTGELKTMRLAQSCNGEYSNWFGAFNAGQVGLVLAAFNATLTRCNGCYEKDLALHLNLIPTTTQVIFYDPLTDPYTTIGAWNNQLQTTLTNLIGEANYDIGHMFGASGGGGNAGCIGCVCVDGQKGRGITSPADGIPQGDNFDIDFVVHEVGHQLGATHTFSFSLEGTGTNKEVGSGITIMGYAGITNFDVAPHSIDIFHQASIQQIQDNLSFKTCPITTNITANNATPVIAPLTNYTIPISTPFALTGSATDANGDPLTYCWEQNDNSTTSDANSIAYTTKSTGPNWLSFPPTSSPTRYCPRLSTILAGGQVTGPLPGGDPGVNIEALSSVARTLNFRLTVRDNSPYSSTAPIKVGQTAFRDMVVTVSNTSGPFQVTAPNTAVTWVAGTTQTVTWNVNNTTAPPVSCSQVNILFSSDGGLTFPITLVSNTMNDGSEIINVPFSPTGLARIKVESVGNIFFDIGNSNFTVAPPPNNFDFNSPAPVVSTCPANPTLSVSLGTIQSGTFTTPIILTSTGNPPGTTVSFSPNPVNPGSPVLVTLHNTQLLNAGNYTITVTGTAGPIVRTRDLVFSITPGTGPSISTQPSNQVVCVSTNASFSVSSPTATAIQWQLSTNGGANWNNISNGVMYSGATTGTLNITGVTLGMNNELYRAVASFQCGSTNSNSALLTVNAAPAITSQPTGITLCAGGNNTFSVTATGGGLNYQWQVSPGGCAGTWVNIAGANGPSYTVSNVTAGMNNTGYRVLVTGSCAPATTSACAILNVITSVSIATQPVNTAVCVGGTTSFSVAGTGAGIIYLWQSSSDGGANWVNIVNGGIYSGAGTGTLTITGATLLLNNYRYRAQLSNSTCTTPGISNSAILTVNTLPAITSSPQNSTICLGGNTGFSSSATGTGLSYQWQVSTDGGANWTNISNGGVYSGATSSTLSLTGVTASMNNYRYRSVASGTCAPAANSNAAVLTVILPVSVTAHPSAAVICSGSGTSFTANGSSTESIFYQWQVSSDGAVSWANLTNGGVYTGTTSNILNLTGVTTVLNNYRYRLLMSSTTCSTPSATNAALLTVRPLPSVNLVAAPKVSLLPGQTTTLTATPSSSTGGTLSTSWMYNGTPAIPAISGNSYVANVQQVGTYQVLVQETFTNPTLVCSNQSPVVTIDAVVSSRLFVFPSPNDGRFTVSYYNAGGTSTRRKIAIFDSKGSIVYNREFIISGLYTLIPIDIQSASRGLYYIVVGNASDVKIAEAKVHIR